MRISVKGKRNEAQQKRIFEILQDELSRLPSGTRIAPLKVLANRFGVGIHTMSEIVHDLDKRNVISIKPGKPTVVYADSMKEESDAVHSEYKSAAERLCEKIAQSIAEGTYTAGEPLPKRRYFVTEERVSVHTVSKAYNLLMQKGLASRRGKKFYAGRTKDAPEFPRHHSMPVLLVVQPVFRYWLRLKSDRTSGFLDRFNEEVQRWGFRLEGFSLSDDLKNRSVEETLRERVKRLDFRYSGALILGPLDRLPGLRSIIQTLTDFKRQIVWFDMHDEKGDLKSNHFFTRCCFSEKRFSIKPLTRLHEFGHKEIAFTGYRHSHTQWVWKRYEYLKEATCKQFGGMKVHWYEDLISGLYSLPVPELAQTLEKRYAKSMQRVCKVLDYLIHALGIVGGSRPGRLCGKREWRLLAEFCSTWGQWGYKTAPDSLSHLYELTPIFLEPTITAFLVSNDRTALYVYDVLCRLELDIPQDISVATYDNYYDAIMQPIATTDNGQANLGYRAFHALINDIPVNKERNGDLISKPTLIDRGTIGPSGI